jgi:small subunit ribosomal protein S21
MRRTESSDIIFKPLFQTSACNGRTRAYFAKGLTRAPVGLFDAHLSLITGVGPIVHVLVRDNNVDQALRALKKKMQREGIFREMKLRRSYEKPSEKRAREKAEAVRRSRKLLRKRMDREGF